MQPASIIDRTDDTTIDATAATPDDDSDNVRSRSRSPDRTEFCVSSSMCSSRSTASTTAGEKIRNSSFGATCKVAICIGNILVDETKVDGVSFASVHSRTSWLVKSLGIESTKMLPPGNLLERITNHVDANRGRHTRSMRKVAPDGTVQNNILTMTMEGLTFRVANHRWPILIERRRRVIVWLIQTLRDELEAHNDADVQTADADTDTISTSIGHSIGHPNMKLPSIIVGNGSCIWWAPSKRSFLAVFCMIVLISCRTIFYAR